MAQEIYHRSNWGVASNEWGSTYLNADLTNELYKRAGYYENSWATDKILNKIGTKPSIILTPTAYEDGKLNSVKPAQVIGEELVINGGFDTDSDWSLGTGWSIANGNAVATSAPSGSQLYQTSLIIGKTYQATFTITDITLGAFRFLFGDGVNTSGNYTSAGTYTVSFTAAGNNRLGIRTVGTTSGSVDNVSVKEVIDADLDFTRGSSATRVNEKGLIQDVQILSDELVQNGGFEQIGSELVTNGGFDTDSDWTLGDSWSIQDGVATQDGTQTAANNYISQLGVTTGGNTYKVSFELVSVESGSIRAVGGGFDWTSDYYDVSDLGFNEFYVTTSSTSQILFAGNADFIGSIDNVSVKEVGQNWTFGTGWSMGDGKAIFDYDTSIQKIYTSNLVLNSSNTYKLSFEIKDILNGTPSIFISNSGGSVGYNGNYTEYYEGVHTFTFSPSSNQTSLAFFSRFSDFSITNISLIEITDDTDLPRINYTNFDYENGEVVPYSGEGSLLLEPQSTNLITYSEDFSQWAKQSGGTGTNPVITSNNAISPDGTKNADKVVFDKGTGTTNANLSILSTSFTSQSNTASFYIKADTPQRIVVRNSNTWLGYDIGTEWTRIEKTDTGGSLQIGLRDGYGIANVPNTATVYLWGAQLEQGSYATSYIPTNGTTVTRLADVANNAGNSDLINSTEGVLYAEIAALADDGTYRLLSLSDGTSNNRVYIGLGNVSNQIIASISLGGTLQAFMSNTVTDTTTYNKIALKYNLNDVSLYVNGTEVATDTSATMPTLTSLQFTSGAASSVFYGKVKSVAVFKEALSDEELHKLTSL